MRHVRGDQHAGSSYNANMSGQDKNAAELKTLAARFVDLWQRQFETMAEDPALSQMMATYSNFAANAASKFDQNGTSDDSRNSAARGATGGPAGAATHGAASGQRSNELDELARRLAVCEERLTALEGGAATGSRGARKRPRKTKP